MKNLPIGIQTFREIRSADWLYVDKTEQIHKLLTGGKYYFLSRPRRFGKSLTLSTIMEMYSGSRELFEGLWIENRWDWSKKYPIIHISFNSLDYHNKGLSVAICEELKQIAEKNSIELKQQTPGDLFKELLEKLCAVKGQVVVLIDEYDKPLIDYLEKDKIHLAKENRTILKGFYSVVKNADGFIKFFMITGVSKFSKVSIFSDLNHLTDLTLHRDASTLTGYTQTELEHYFAEWLAYSLPNFDGWSKEKLLEEIQIWYNGYSWDGKNRVYNPFSILLFFSSGEFRDYWFKTGTPTFLINLLQESEYYLLDNLEVSQRVFDSYDLENIEIRSLLFQTGYLTIKSINRERNLYKLSYPNKEVEQAMHEHLLALLTKKDPHDVTVPIFSIGDAFVANDLKRVIEIINSLLKDIPSHLLRRKKEDFYHALVHLHFRYLGLFMDSEVNTSDGRMDAVVQTQTHVYILEFKINESGERALQQITDKGYADKYRMMGKTIVGVGVSFNTRRRSVGSWKSELLG